MENDEHFDYTDLSNFLKTPRTAVELEKKYKCKRNTLYSIITHATFKMPLYEFKNEDGKLCYGLIGGTK